MKENTNCVGCAPLFEYYRSNPRPYSTLKNMHTLHTCKLLLSELEKPFTLEGFSAISGIPEQDLAILFNKFQIEGLIYQIKPGLWAVVR